MSSGADHFRSAEELAAEAMRRDDSGTFYLDPTYRATLLQAAQVHATLAHTAATAAFAMTQERP